MTSTPNDSTSKTRRQFAWLALGSPWVLSACAGVDLLAAGDVALENGLIIKAGQQWNRVRLAGDAQPVEQVWTQDGLPLDNLRIWSGVAHQSPMAKAIRERSANIFKAEMAPDEVIALFQAMYTNRDASFTLTKAEPAPFLGGPGTRFEFALQGWFGPVKRKGLGVFAIRNKQLYAMVYTAPQLSLYARHAAEAEQIIRTARLK